MSTVADRGPARWADPRYARRVGQWEALTNAVTPALLAALAPAPGERLLDVGCGAGAATIRAAARVRPAGSVVGADISPLLVQMATERAVGLDNVRFHRADLQTARVPGGPFDVIMSQFGVLFFEDPVAAFGNIRGHLLPGARLGFSCWQSVDRNAWSYARLLTDLTGTRPAPVGAPGPFRFADPADATATLRAAGFRDIDITPRSGVVEVAEQAVVDDTELAIMGVPAEHLIEARRRVDEHLLPYRTAAGTLQLPLAYYLVTARG